MWSTTESATWTAISTFMLSWVVHEMTMPNYPFQSFAEELHHGFGLDLGSDINSFSSRNWRENIPISGLDFLASSWTGLTIPFSMPSAQSFAEELQRHDECGLGH